VANRQRQKLLLAVLAVLATVSACSPSVKQPETPGAEAVVLSAAAPPPGYVKVTALAIVSGKGCGVMGTPGSADEARALARNEATKLGASYVQITRVEKPPINHQCIEHEHKLKGIAYRRPAPPLLSPQISPAATTAITPTPATPVPAPLVTIQDYEATAPSSKPAPATNRSSIALALVPGEAGGSSLSVQYMCSGDDQRADLDVWSRPITTDWSHARALSLRVKPSAALALSVSFMDGNHSGYTQQSEPLVPGQWQTVLLPFDKFWLNPFGPPGDVKGAPQDRTNVQAFGFAPRGCTNGHFLIDDISLAQ
jgi:hypothetical protein